jgi:hypothetical protein
LGNYALIRIAEETEVARQPWHKFCLRKGSSPVRGDFLPRLGPLVRAGGLFSGSRELAVPVSRDLWERDGGQPPKASRTVRRRPCRPSPTDWRGFPDVRLPIPIAAFRAQGRLGQLSANCGPSTAVRHFRPPRQLAEGSVATRWGLPRLEVAQPF